MKILVIGDSCTDVFVYGQIDRLCPEAPVPIFQPVSQKQNGGMARNVKNNLVALGADVHIISNDNGMKKVRYVDANTVVYLSSSVISPRQMTRLNGNRDTGTGDFNL